MTLAWVDVASIDITDRAAVFLATDGRSTTIDLNDLKQPQAIIDALIHARALLDESRHAAHASIESTTTSA